MAELHVSVGGESLEDLLAPFTAERPGLALLVSRGDEVVFERYLGAADLEHGAPVTAATRFHVASVSKQFTAFAILQLARLGDVDLDADVHDYLPELPDYGARVTLADLVHHTSGLRDQWELLALSGTSTSSLIRQQAIVAIAASQKRLNFAPGMEIRYSNTGYSLLAEVIARKAGMPFRRYMWEKIFAPLGMSRTLVYDNVSELLSGRAMSYSVGHDGTVRHSRLNYSNYGATSLQTTPRDLMKWGRELLRPTVFNADLIMAATTAGHLRDGQPHNYAFGVIRDRVGNLDALRHGGADAGYRAFFACFPNQDACVVVLSNGKADVGALALSLARAFLGASAEEPVAASASWLEACAGYYVNDWAPGMTLEARGGELHASTCGHALGPVTFLAGGDFYITSPSKRFTPGPNGSLIERQDVGGLDLVHRPLARASWTPAAMRALEGAYRSEELDVTYWLKLNPTGLVLSSLRNASIPLMPAGPDSFEGGGVRVDIVMDSRANVTGLNLATGRVRNLQFDRLAAG